MRKKFTLKLRNRELCLGEKTLIMGILNVTPDSFSDGGRYYEKSDAITQAFQMIKDGADIIDVGGESTRPGAEAVSIEEELRRVIPVIEGIRKKSDIPISIDTYKSNVAEACLLAGTDIINDISGCRFDPQMAPLAAKTNTPIIIMHIKGTPKNMQSDPQYQDIIKEIRDYLVDSIELLTSAGLPKEQIVIDPGIGFGKTTEHNLTIMNELQEFSSLDRPILIGVSNKSVIGNVLDQPIERRSLGTAAAVAANIMKGAHIVRVHDAAGMKQVAMMTDAIISLNS